MEEFEKGEGRDVFLPAESLGGRGGAKEPGSVCVCDDIQEQGEFR
jgi:hypothetical protein